ncbi:MAG TPA: class I SAM-dependent methyltransferase [Terracidiphilus sp.]|jgi:Zn ribbon nucleic-acid-binding protein|nr:class I SAM-dependent methyltransferase [Terracidiphilus sp.]
MIEVTQCVVCGGEIRKRRRALVAPFLAERVWNKAPFCVDLVECAACGFLFYNPRLDDADLQQLYRNYRSEEYQQMRHISEPWYTPAFNTDLASAASYVMRRAKVGAILREHLGARPIRRILDYGGDRGDLVAGLLEGAEAFVYDISGIPAAPGVTSISDPAACNADLIVNSNVLEHVGFPRALVADMLRACPEKGFVYIELPSESPFGLRKLTRRIALLGITTIMRPSIAAQIARPASLYMMHEHINYFSEKSLTTLLRASGGTVIASGTHSEGGRYKTADTTWCLGMRV